MAYLKSYKELIVWQKSIKLAQDIFILTNLFPQSELYGIVSQMRRASVSIASNIAEGYGRNSVYEYSHFFNIAYGSALELETQLIISKELKLANKIDFTSSEALLIEVCKMLNKMTKSVKILGARR